MNLLGEKKLHELASFIISYSKADQTEVLLMRSEHALTRYANSFIHQNVFTENVTIQVRVIIGKKIGVASTNSFDSSSLKNVVKTAMEIAKLSRDDKDFNSLPKPKNVHKVTSFSDNTVRFGSLDRARAVQVIIKKAKLAQLTSAGSYEISISELAVMNNLGVWAYQPTTQANLTAVLTGPTSTGFAASLNKDSSLIDPLHVVETAIKKVQLGANPISIPSGDYEVILEPPAVAEMMDFFSYLAVNGRIFHEQASFLRDKMDKKIFSSKLTLFDDPLNFAGIPQSFDFEGYPKNKLVLIEKGVPKNIVYDSYLAAKNHKPNTGHALPAPNTDGPIPGHLLFEPGIFTTEQLIKKVKKGILITRFWYVRMLHHYLLNITGMTRDGTFLIENGKIVSGIKNLRFTQSIPEALQNIEAISKDTTASPAIAGTGLYPSLFISKFHFSSSTEF